MNDNSATKYIRIDYQLDNFAALREFIFGHTNERALQAPSGTRLFHHSWINKIIFAVFGLPFWIFSMQWYHQGVADGFYFTFSFGMCALLAIAFDPVSLRIDTPGFVIKYPLWNNPISFDSISGIFLKDVNRRGNMWATVVIERRHKRSIRLYRFREGSIAMKSALESAWQISQASRVDTGMQSAVEGE